jgi:hypothetical protein
MALALSSEEVAQLSRAIHLSVRPLPISRSQPERGAGADRGRGEDSGGVLIRGGTAGNVWRHSS